MAPEPQQFCEPSNLPAGGELRLACHVANYALDTAPDDPLVRKPAATVYEQRPELEPSLTVYTTRPIWWKIGGWQLSSWQDPF